ncbi:MAG: hypothetical protein AAGD06_20105 [Acidobacteriota bacterium]
MNPESDRRSDRGLDTRLRRSLDPDPRQVERLVNRALRPGDPAEVPDRRPWGPRQAAFAAVVVLCFALPFALTLVWNLPEPGMAPPATHGDLAPDPDLSRSADVGAASTAAKPLLRISNEGGFVTVTSNTGSQLVLLPGDP